MYESGTIEKKEEEEKVERTFKSNLGQEITPTARHKQNVIKAELNYAAKNHMTPKV